MRFKAPPSWPDPPSGWVPDASWSPDEQWGEAPAQWDFWVDDTGEPVAGPAGLYGGRGPRTKRKVAGAAAVAFLVGLILAPDGPGTSTPAGSTEAAAPTTVTHEVVSTQEVTETVTAAPTTVTAAPATVTEQVTATETVEVTHTETVVADGDGGGAVGFYDSGDGGSDSQTSVYYQNCDAARAAGAAPVRRGDPGYDSHLDRDGDGVGCER